VILMQGNRSDRRRYGTGAIIVKAGAYFGKWRVGGRQVMRKIGPVRQPGTREGLTRTQAESKLRAFMAEMTHAPPQARVGFAEVAERYLYHVEHVMERKPSTTQDYRIMLRKHLGPHFVGKSVERITTDDVAAYIALKRRDGLASKTVGNHLTFAHGVFAFALKRGLVPANPVSGVDRPRPASVDADFRFLDREQLEALLRAVPDDKLGHTDHALYLTAGLTGLRQGELVALRWRMNVMSLPDEEARELGLPTGPLRIAIVTAATLVT